MELKECPFCRGKAHFTNGAIARYITTDANAPWQVWHSCRHDDRIVGNYISTSFYVTKEEAAAAWNARAERACRNVGRPERDGEDFVCSECGCTWSLIAGTLADNGMSYCPGCGARIED